MPEDVAQYFAMGGYAGFVWSAYAVTAIVTIGLIVWSVRGHQAARARVVALEASVRKEAE